MNNSISTELAGWGRYPVATTELFRPEKIALLGALLKTERKVIGRGSGLSYGDAALCADGATVDFSRLNRFRHFDHDSGILECEAGVRLEEILALTVPHGWFLPVTPGTRFPTLGGCLACDVHGKNHHRDGSLSNHVRSCRLLLADGQTVSCSRSENTDLFRATAGGMGLTGFIQTISLQLIPIDTAYISQFARRTDNLGQTLAALTEANQSSRYTVAWLDTVCGGKALGRGIVYAGNTASRDELPKNLQASPYTISPKHPRTIPFDLPAWVMNRATIKAFNFCYYHRAAADQQQSILGYDTFFYPLDALLQWNRLYGKRGFLQYQCVLPLTGCEAGIHDILTQTATTGGSFLSVLKIMGHQEGLLSFPMEGVTLAMDFPRHPGIESLMEKLDRLVLEHKGRLYLAKDARLNKDTFAAMQPNLERWLKIKKEVDPHNRFSSSLSRRIGLS